MQDQFISFTIRKHYDKLGFHMPLLILIQSEYMPLKTFTDTLTTIDSLQDPRVHTVFTVSGSYTMGIIGMWENKEQYGKWKGRFINDFLICSGHQINVMDEIVIWDYYKQEGASKVQVPTHMTEE
jgi:hypothetical protein